MCYIITERQRRFNMRTMTQMQALDKMSDNDMAKRIILAILNTPKPDYEAMRQQSRKYEAELVEEMSDTDKLKLMEINSAL